MFSIFFVFLYSLVGLLLFHNFYWKRRKFPPGPTPLPLLGNLHQIPRSGEQPEARFLEWRRKYGDVFTVWLGEQPVVCVARFNKIMDTFQRDGETYAGRLNYEEYDAMTKGGLFGVVFTEGELWREQRRFTLHVLRDFGMGKNVAQEKILDEIELMFQRIDREIGHPQNEEVNIGQMLDINIGSIINNLLFGYRFDDDKLDEFRRLKGFLDDFLANFYAPIQMLFRWNPRLFRRLPYFRGILNGTIKKNRNFLDFFGGQIQAHLKRGIDFADLDSSSTDFVEAYLKEMAKRDATGEKHGFSIDQLKQLCADLWLGGQETTSTTLAWAIAYLLNNPNVKQKMQRELDEVIGSREAVIKMENRRELPYMNAAINEIQRMANLLPVNLVHKLTRDVVIDGHFLPKGCAINPLISAVLADDEIFENPKQFRPERFLDEKGKLKRVDALIPFSVGKRQCLGESLARMELFLFLANLLNKYEFWPGMDGMPSLMRHFGGTVHCPAYTCRIQKREGRGAA